MKFEWTETLTVKGLEKLFDFIDDNVPNGILKGLCLIVIVAGLIYLAYSIFIHKWYIQTGIAIAILIFAEFAHWLGNGHVEH